MSETISIIQCLALIDGKILKHEAELNHNVAQKNLPRAFQTNSRLVGLKSGKVIASNQQSIYGDLVPIDSITNALASHIQESELEMNEASKQAFFPLAASYSYQLEGLNACLRIIESGDCHVREIK